MIKQLQDLPDASQDCVISLASLQHLMTTKQRRLFFLESYRVLKYDGLFVTVNRSYSEWFLKKYMKQQLQAI